MRILKIRWFIFIVILSANQAAFGQNIDHELWDKLLNKNIISDDGGRSTQVNYDAMMNDRKFIKDYLDTLSTVSENEFYKWSKQDQLAFLINSYNASTVALVLTAWPNLKSIKELGGWFSSPWEIEFVSLLGKTRSLDDIEHNLIRGSGRYNDPRIHFAVNCASIGCPALRAEAYIGSKLDEQLREQTNLFLSDQSRNRVESSTIKLSSIFKWYRDDFEKGWKGFDRLEEFLLAHAEDMAIAAPIAQKLKLGKAKIEFMDYDWRLNEK
jgi:hypothetical protein